MNEKPEPKLHSNSGAARLEFKISRVIGCCIVAASVCILFGLVAWLCGKQALEKGGPHLNDLGNFGSYLQGTTASLWALAGVFIIFVAFLIQAMQFADQRKQFKVQSDSISRQNFENKFFQLLNIHHTLVSDMADDENTGRNCFEKWHGLLRNRYGVEMELHVNGGGNLSDVQQVRQLCIRSYGFVFQRLQGNLGHYFRNLYHIIKFVDRAPNLNDADKKEYAALVRAQLSAFELALLFYNCIHSAGEKFYPYVSQYRLLHNLDEDLILAPNHHDLYPRQAYDWPKDAATPNPSPAQPPPGGIVPKSA